jgi:hypothetical protein
MVIVEEEKRELVGVGIEAGSESEYEDVDDSLNENNSNSWAERMRERAGSWFQNSSLSGFFSRMYTFVSGAVWVITTSLILIGLPVLYAYDREQNAVTMEREQQRFDSK